MMGRFPGLRQAGLRRAGDPGSEGSGGSSISVVGGTSTSAIDRIIESRAQSLTGVASLNYWSDPFFQVPGRPGSLWQDVHAVDVHPIASAPGGVLKFFTNVDYGSCLIDSSNSYPFSPSWQPSWFGNMLAPPDGCYMAWRFQINSQAIEDDPSGGWDPDHSSLILGMVDAETLNVIGVGLGGGATHFGAVNGDLNAIGHLTGMASSVALDFDVWHWLELYRTGGAWWLKVDNGTAIDVSALYIAKPLTYSLPIMQIQTDHIAQPSIWIDHVAFTSPRAAGGTTLQPLGPDPGGVAGVTAEYPLASSGGANPIITMPNMTSLGDALLFETTGGAEDGRDLLDLGSLSTQNADAVAITGGSITGLPEPSGDSDAATKAYVDAAGGGGGGGEEPTIQMQIPTAGDSQNGLLLGFIPPGFFPGDVVIEVFVPVVYDGDDISIELHEDVAGANNVVATDIVNSGTPGTFVMLHAVTAPFTPTALDQIRLDILYAVSPLDGSFQGLLLIKAAPAPVSDVTVQFHVQSVGDSTVGAFLGFIPPGLFSGDVILEAFIPVAYDGDAITINIREDVTGANTIVATDTVDSGSPGFVVLHAVSAPLTPTALDQIRLDIEYAVSPIDGSFAGVLLIRPA